MATDTKKRKPRPRCIGCDKVRKLYPDVCEECEEDYEWCNVCGSSQSRTDECRHLTWTDWGYTGSGSYEGEWINSRSDFLAFLDVMAKVKDPRLDDGFPDLVTAMETEIGQHRFYTRLEGFMLSTPTLYFYRERPDLPQRNDDGSPYCLSFARIEAHDIEDDEGEVADGFGWLQSLCCGDTKDANTVTAEWVRLWRANQRLVVLNEPESLREDWVAHVLATCKRP